MKKKLLKTLFVWWFLFLFWISFSWVINFSDVKNNVWFVKHENNLLSTANADDEEDEYEDRENEDDDYKKQDYKKIKQKFIENKTNNIVNSENTVTNNSNETKILEIPEYLVHKAPNWSEYTIFNVLWQFIFRRSNFTYSNTWFKTIDEIISYIDKNAVTKKVITPKKTTTVKKSSTTTPKNTTNSTKVTTPTKTTTVNQKPTVDTTTKAS